MTRVGVLIAGAIGAMGAMVATGTAEAKGARTRARLEPAEVASAGDGLGASEPAVTSPAASEMDDAMLRGAPSAAHVVADLKQALALVRAHSESLHAARADVQAAEGRAGVVLAAALPTLLADAGLLHQVLRGDGFRFDAASNMLIPSRIPNPATDWNASITARVPVLAPQAWFDRGT